MEQTNSITYEGVKYALVKDEVGGGCECDRCALQEQCGDKSGRLCCDIFGDEATWDMRFEVVKEDEKDDVLTEQQIYDDYQERSITAGNRAEQLAWAFIVILCAQLIGSEHFREPYVIAAGGIAYMLLSSLQALWQAFAMWLFKNRVKRLGLAVDDYPQWLGGTAWAIYWAKMIVIAVTSVYAVWHFVRLL